MPTRSVLLALAFATLLATPFVVVRQSNSTPMASAATISLTPAASFAPRQVGGCGRSSLAVTDPSHNLALTVTLDAFEPSQLTINAGEPYKVMLENHDASYPHAWRVEGTTSSDGYPICTPLTPPSASSSETFEIDQPGTYTFLDPYGHTSGQIIVLPGTPQPRSTPTGPIFLALGDSVLAGCCGDASQGAAVLFTGDLSHQRGEQVTLVDLATASITSEQFINDSRLWLSGRTTSQLMEAASVLHDAQAQDRHVVAIALLVGGNDFLYLTDPPTGTPCYITAAPACAQLFASALTSYGSNLDTIINQLDQAKDASTPLFLLNQYNPFDTGADTPQSRVIEAALGAVNNTIAQAATAHGAYLVDIHTLFRGRAASLVEDVDPSLAGHRVIADALAQAYTASQVTVTPTGPTATPAPAALPSTGTGTASAAGSPVLAELLACAVLTMLAGLGLRLALWRSSFRHMSSR